MNHFDEELARRKQAETEETAREQAKKDSERQESMRMAAYELESTKEVRAWAAQRLSEIASSKAKTLVVYANVPVRRIFKSDRLERRPVETVRGWPVKVHEKHSFEFGTSEVRALYLLADARIAIGGPSEVRIIENAADWHAVVGYAYMPADQFEYGSLGSYADLTMRRQMREEGAWYSIHEEDFMSAVHRYTAS